MIFTKQRNLVPTTLPKLNDSPIPKVSQFKFLGLILDPRLTMTHHVNRIQVLCQRRLNLFKCLTSTPIGADRAILLRLYKSIVLPIIEYGCVMYAGGTESSLHKLEAVQNNFLRLALGVLKTSPILSLQVESNITPLYIRRMDLTFRYYSKIKQITKDRKSTRLNSSHLA